MNDMKLIMEGWRDYVKTLDYTDPRVYIIEGKENNTQKSLSVLFEESRKGLLTEQEVLQMWRKSVLYESQQLINENVMEKLAAGWEAVKRGGQWLTDKVMQAYAWAVKQFNNFFINLYGGISMALSKAADAINSNMYIQSVLEDLGMLRDKILDFKTEHPVIWKFGVVMLACGALLSVMAFYSSEAQAIVMKGDVVVDEKTLSGMKSTLDAACTADRTVCGDVQRAIRTLNDYSSAAQGGAKGDVAMHAKDVLDLASKNLDETGQILRQSNGWFESIKKVVFDAYNETSAQVDAAAASGGNLSPELSGQVDEVMGLFDDLKNMVEEGRKITFRTLEVIIEKGEGISRRSMKMGGKLHGDVPREYGAPLAKGIQKIINPEAGL